VRAALTLAPVALLATSCGAQSDPYAASLEQGTVHVEFHGVVRGREVQGSGDFRGETGALITRANGAKLRQVVVGHRIYVKTVAGWRTSVTSGPNTPEELFRKRLPATIEDGLVRRIVVKRGADRITYEFSRYGEQVSVTIPRVKGSK
jgi:hypothetical protein